MKSLRPSVKVGIVFLGLIGAFAIAWLAVDLRQRTTQGPDSQAASGMYAAGEMILGIGVFGLIALVPLVLGLYWLRPVRRFWSVLAWGALLFGLTGLWSLAVNLWASQPLRGWMLLTQMRIGFMPLTAMILVICGCFAPRLRDRWMLLTTGVTDGLIFAGVVIVKFLLPGRI